MGKSKKGLADEGRGDFILNESGTSVNIDHVNDDTTEQNDEVNKKSKEDDEPYMPPTAEPQKDVTD